MGVTQAAINTHSSLLSRGACHAMPAVGHVSRLGQQQQHPLNCLSFRLCLFVFCPACLFCCCCCCFNTPPPTHTGSNPLARKGLADKDPGGLEAIVAEAKRRKASGATGGPEFSIDLSKLSLEQLERLREKAREKQWEDDWWNSYVKYETDKKAAQDKEWKAKEKQTISQFNLTLSRCVCVWVGWRVCEGSRCLGCVGCVRAVGIWVVWGV